MPTRLKHLSRPKLKQPVLVAGLPGIANVGKLALEYLVQKLSAEKFLELYSDYFPEWVIQEEGRVSPLKVDFFHCRPEGMKQDLILVTSDAQAATPLGQYALTGELLDVAVRHGVKLVGTMAAYVVSPEERRSYGVVGAASDVDLAKALSESGVKLLNSGVIVGMNGMLPVMATRRGLRGFCLLGVTEGGVLDAGASAAVLRSLAAVLNFKLELKDLEQQARKLAKLIPPPPVSEIGGVAEEEPSYIR
ncbi:MAG: PAC2 family protein [Candidatus Hadarchaeum sp.]|uniref:PAC2 family protein n=1 Tax=Candidatus Hadarchaeum sp. TaxID=2883567 RepID=UPI0031701FF0